MASRYENATEDVLILAREIISQYFPEIINVKIKYLFDLKKCKHAGKLVFGKCQKPNDLVKHFTVDETKDADGYQFVTTLDKVAWEIMDETDKARLLRHELRHAGIDEEGKPYIEPHNIEDFVEEITLNADNPDWARELGKKVRAAYK